ncbi:hypothetical protein SLEP1_g33045 [Rubroshorea leprosula]|uniref:Uncharacterized protein n=1 Tax=Rubroshorea leprosula TaxID=152421 RepID=A0AAV5KFJ0_9ROSI|nr:hypothetical protein SLEP1_g33045 [Rubroshorea leprosula]
MPEVLGEENRNRIICQDKFAYTMKDHCMTSTLKFHSFALNRESFKSVYLA